MKIQKSKIKFRNSKTKFKKQENKIQDTPKIKLGTQHNTTQPKTTPENHQNMVPKHKNYDPKLPENQAEKSQITKKHAKKGSKQDQTRNNSEKETQENLETKQK